MRQKSKLFGVLDFLGRQKIVEIKVYAFSVVFTISFVVRHVDH